MKSIQNQQGIASHFDEVKTAINVFFCTGASCSTFPSNSLQHNCVRLSINWAYAANVTKLRLIHHQIANLLLIRMILLFFNWTFLCKCYEILNVNNMQVDLDRTWYL